MDNGRMDVYCAIDFVFFKWKLSIATVSLFALKVFFFETTTVKYHVAEN